MAGTDVEENAPPDVLHTKNPDEKKGLSRPGS